MSAAMERPQQRPRSHTTFSFKSDKSHGSNPKNEKNIGQHQRQSSGEQKAHLHAATKADPNAAMNEVQPSMYIFPLPSCWRI